MSEEKKKSRWFSTGYMAHGVESVKAETHSLENANVIQVGEAKGHGIWIDEIFVASVVEAGNATAEKGLKARFGHPDMCSDALGTFLGKWKNFSIGSDGIAKGTLFLSSTASESPKGDLRKYIEEMATKEPDYFGTSIVFSGDREKEEDFIVENGGVYVFGKGEFEFVKLGETKNREEIPEGCFSYVETKDFKSPDSRNVNNYPHARLAKLHAADLVDDPAATDSMFSGVGGTELASKVSEYLDTHPEILKSLSENSEIVEILSKYPEQIKPFIARFTDNRKEQKQMATETITEVAESTTTTETVTVIEKTEEAKPEETAESVNQEEAKPSEEVAPVGETERPELSRDEFKKIVTKFGNDIAVRCMLENGTYETALSWHVEAIESENADLKAKVSEFTGSKSTTGKPVAMSAAGTQKKTLLAMCEKGTKGKV
jgi:hypothetical protein